MGASLNLALKNLTRKKRRNAILAIAIAFGFFVVTSIDGFISGVVYNFEDQITQLTGGTVLMQGFEQIPAETEGEKPKLINIVRDRQYIENLIKNSNIQYQSYSCYTSTVGQMIFEGKKSLTQLYGRNLEDSSFLNSLQYISGGIENLSDPQALIITDKTADSMNLEVGDQLIISTSTIYGQNNFADFTIAAIIKSNSFTNTIQCYSHLDYVNELVGIPAGGYSTFTINLENKNLQSMVANILEAQIRKDGHNVTSRIQAAMDSPRNIGRGIEKQIDVKNNTWEGTKYAVETLYDEFPQIQEVLLYVHIISTIILITILFIVMIGVSNTYRMILYERIREIGTMRALGMTRKITKRIFSLEAIILCVIGAAGGMILSFIVMGIIHLIPVTNDALLLFTMAGHFTFKISASSIIIQYLLLILLTFCAVRGSAKKAAKMSPAQALRTVK